MPASCKLPSSKSLPKTLASLILTFFSSFLISVIALEVTTKFNQAGLTVFFLLLIISTVWPLFRTVDKGESFLSISHERQ